MRKILLSVVIACTWSLVSAQVALGASVALVSHGDPFASCTLGVPDPALYPPGYTATVYPGAEVEPWIAVDPRSAQHLVGVWQQDRWSDGGAKGLVAGRSSDGGKTWRQITLPFSLCAAPYYGGAVAPYDRASDPWVSIGPDGRVYAVGLSFNENDFNQAITAAVSTDGGKTWIHEQNVITDLDSDPDQLGDDKEAVTADPTRPGYAYVVWDRFETVKCGPSAATTGRAPILHDRAPRRARVTTAATVCGWSGPTWFSRTTNGGVTWSTPKVIVRTGTFQQTIGNQIVVDHETGTLYDFYNYIDDTGFHVKLSYSNDQGTTWSAPQLVGDLHTFSEVRDNGIVDPRDPTIQIRTGDIIPEPAIDPNTGQLYVVWQDGRFSGANANDMVVISTSSGGGRTGTWSPAKLVNPLASKAAFTPSIVVSEDGRVGVSYYDFRSLGPRTKKSNLPTDYWLATTSGPGVNFTSERHADGPFNMLDAPVARGYFVGDYEGLVAAGDVFTLLYVRTNCAGGSCGSQGDGLTDVFSTAIGVGNGDRGAD